MSKGWIGVDFDGTLATYTSWTGLLSFGEPIAPMVHLVQLWLSEGKDVRVFTARLNYEDPPEVQEKLRQAIFDWTHKHIGTGLTTTAIKDLHMIELYDDRAIQVERNTGKIVGYSTR